MKNNTIKWRIFKYNLIVIIMLIAFTSIVFNIAVLMYIESDITKQLNRIALRAKETVLHSGPDFFPHGDEIKPPPPPDMKNNDSPDIFRFYFMLDRSLREPLSLLNADYILLDINKEIISSPEEAYFRPSDDILHKVKNEIVKINDTKNQKCIGFALDSTEYIAIIEPVSSKNSFGLGWIITYSSLEKVNQLQWGINTILFIILILSALITVIFASLAAKKISAPFSSLNQHIRSISERNFGSKINISVDDELQEFVNNINTMSEKLELYDKAQKTFLQNASHEFRTPLMSIQSHAEGIKYNVVDHAEASNIIIDETKRMTHLVEDLLYLSRLDTIQENYHFNSLDFNDFIDSCIERMKGIASNYDIQIEADTFSERIQVYADEEKFSRAFTNIISNCIRYSSTTVRISSKRIENKIEVTICDDGPGIDEKELPNIFERFYKGKKGNFGLGLAISKNIINKHKGIIIAENSKSGAVFKIVLPIK